MQAEKLYLLDLCTSPPSRMMSFTLLFGSMILGYYAKSVAGIVHGLLLNYSQLRKNKIIGVLTLSPMMVVPVCHVGDPLQITCTASVANTIYRMELHSGQPARH